MDRSDWKLSPAIFQKIDLLFDPLEVDSFTSRLTAQTKLYYSWRPDPLAVGTDAFLQDWTNPPWCLIGRTLSHVQTQSAQIVLVAPVWKAQPWYPLLLEMTMGYPRLILDNPVVLDQHPSRLLPQLAVWHISRRDTLVNTFQRRLHHSCSSHGAQKQINLTTHSLGDGIAGVVNGVQIPFLAL